MNVVAWSVWADTIKMRSPFVAAGLLLCVAGFSVNIADVSIGVKYFGTFLIATGGYAAFPAITSWCALSAFSPSVLIAILIFELDRIPNNVGGHYKRAVAISIDVIFGNCGGIIASNVYRAQDAPRYVMGRTSPCLPCIPSGHASSSTSHVSIDAIELGIVGLGLILTPIAAFIYSRINARRDALLREEVEKGVRRAPEELRQLGDRAPDFKYML